MLNKSIAYRLSIFISLAVISVFISFIIVSYIFNRNILKQNLESKAMGVASEITMIIEKKLVATREVTNNVSNQILFYRQNNGVESFLSWLMAKYPFMNAIRISFYDDEMEQNYRYYYCYREKDSLKFIQQNAEIVYCNNHTLSFSPEKQGFRGWSEPFRCPLNGNVIVSFSAPVEVKSGSTETQNVIGEVVCELSLLDLNESINSYPFEESSYAFLLSKDGTYITHPKEDWILNRNVLELPDKIYDKDKIDVSGILNEGQMGSAVAYAETLNFKKTRVYYTPVKESGWTLLLVMPYNELFEPLYISTLQMLFFSVLGILVIYLIITFITNRLIEPLSNVTSKLKQFSSASGAEQLHTLNEVKLVSESLNYIKSWYENYKAQASVEEVRSKRRKEDLKQASEIQQSLIKTDFPAFPDRNDIDLFAIYKAANVVSGDLFDYFFIDKHRLVFTIGDVSGKGIPAAIFMSVAQTIIKGNASLGKAKDIISASNKELTTNNQHQFFLTLFLGVLNVKTGLLNFCNAAHTSALILKSNGEVEELTKSNGLPLGLYADKKYTDSKVQLQKNDTLVLFTDGVTDLQDANKLHFGFERFRDNVSHLTKLTPEEMIKRLDKSLMVYKGNVKQTDDITLMAIKWL